MPPAEQLPDAVFRLHYGFAGQVACRAAGRGYSASTPLQDKIERTANVERSANVVQLSGASNNGAVLRIAMQAMRRC